MEYTAKKKSPILNECMCMPMVSKSHLPGVKPPRIWQPWIQAPDLKQDQMNFGYGNKLTESRVYRKVGFYQNKKLIIELLDIML